MRKKSSLLMKSMCYTLCGAMVLSTPSLSSLAAISETLYAGNTEIAAYITTTPRMMVGDTVIANISGAPDMVKSVSGWYRSATGDYEDAEPISGETGISYTYTADDVGYYIFAVVSAQDSEGEYVKLATNMTPGVVQANITEVESWIQSSEYDYFEYDFVDGLDGKVQVRLVTDAFEIFREQDITEITVPSTIDGYEVYRIADDAFDTMLYGPSDGAPDGSSMPELNNIKISEGIVEIGKSTAIYSTEPLVIPKSVQLIEEDAIQNAGYIYTANSGTTSQLFGAKRVVVLNPTVHFEDSGIPVSRESGVGTGNPIVYVGAEGSSIHNVYDETINSWVEAGKTSPEGSYYVFEDSGVYNATQNAVDISAEDELQQKLDMNDVEWILSADGQWYYDVIDGTDDVLVKPADVQMVASGTIVFPETLDSYDVAAAVVAPTTSNMHYDIPNGVIVDNATLDNQNYIDVVSGNEGSTTQQFANDNNLIFHNKDVELTTREQFDNADLSNSFTSEDGYWSYQFIDGYNSVVITNIKKFETGICEVPTEIDGYKVSVFSTGSMAKEVGTYDDVILPDGLVAVKGDFYQVTGASAMGFKLYGTVAKNITIYDRDIDLSDVGSIGTTGVTSVTGYTGSTADAICINRIDGTKNADGIISATFIPLDEENALECLTISGTNKAGKTLTAKLTPTLAKADIQWMISDDNTTFTAIDGATATTLTLTEEMTGKYVKAQATGTGAFSGTVESNVMQVAASTATQVTSITGTYNKNIGSTSTSAVKPTSATVTYQWYRDTATSSANTTGEIPETAVLIEGATESSYVATAEDYNHYLFVTATGTGDYFGTAKAASSSSVVAANLTNVAISGNTYAKPVGTKLTTTLTPTAAIAEYQWYRADASYTNLANLKTAIENGNAVAIDGATESTYTTAPEDYNKYITVIAKGSVEDGYAGEVMAYLTKVVSANFTGITISGNTYTKYVGDKLTTTLTPTASVVEYQWYRADSSYTNLANLKTAIANGNAVAIDGATESSYTTTAEDVGKFISVVAVGSNEDGYAGENMSYLSRAVLGKITSATIDGEPYVGETLTAVPDLKDATATYKWYSRTTNSTSTSGATQLSTEKTYTLTENEIGKYVFCYVTGSGSYTGSVYTNVVGAVEEKVITPLESINLSGTHKVGQTLTATIAPTDATVDYKWYRADSADATDWTEIAGATSATYALTEDDENMFIKVVATATGNYEGEVEAVSSSSIASNKTELSDVVIDGVLKVGETVSVVIEPEDATVDIKWSVSDSKDGVFTEVGTGADFELTEDYEGKYIKVEVVGNGDYVGTKEVVSDTTIQAENTIAQITKVTVSGISMVGEKLTANVYPSSVNADIKWLVSDTADGEYTEIGTGSTYTLTENELGKFVKAEATNADDNTNVILSNATSAVSDKLSEDDNVDEYGRIIDSVERVEYVTEEMSEAAFIGTEERDCLVYASQGQEFVVRIPKVLTMDGSSSSASIDFETELTANISGYDTITIEPDSTSIAMAESTGVKRDITCNLTVGQTQFSIANDTQEALEVGKVANHSASVDGISAGEWRGTFNWLIKARGQKTTDSEENVEY